ncbi:MAG: tRNA uridine(34) 5-carboxymethylaminomethyl modification radical SAM/GNAT enzyme Elp3, partial [Candidatus Diapherotrites archaeon]|nr:tRNA uridine(34) 5-carboxymethylaminomethyl modification radical SAM/GNAT enzyme Elp3 [Candidatus Diapherotrites archaeon]
MNNPLKTCCRELIDLILDETITTRSKLNHLKKFYCKKNNINLPTNAQVLSFAKQSEIQKIIPLLLKKPVRTLSGVSPVAVMTSPEKCPHGKCLMCPGDLDKAPQSYTGDEPAAMRGIQNNFDPFKQTTERVKQLKLSGHHCDKTELIIMGGTFTAR